jgi:hypothetical protein
LKAHGQKKYKARIRVLGFCFLFLLFTFGAVHSQPAPSFQVMPADDIYADSARFYLNFFEQRLSKTLGYALDTTVTLYLAANENEFLRDAGVTIPDWGAGLALMDRARIVIKSPKYMQVNKSFQELIGHELAHIMLYRAAGQRWLPRWLQEGFAMHSSGEWHIGQDILVARAAWTGRLIPLHHMEDLMTFKGMQAQLAYTESYLAVSHLLDRSDPYLLSDFLAVYRQNGDFYADWKSEVGSDYVSWISGWLSTTSRQYHFFIFLLDSEMFWIILAVAFLLLFLLKKRQNARTRRRWQIEERLHPPDESYKSYYDGYYDEENKV